MSSRRSAVGWAERVEAGRRRAADRVQREQVAVGVSAVIEERTEARARHAGGGVGHGLQQRAQVALRRQRAAGAVE
jgi:hypothetical protein